LAVDWGDGSPPDAVPYPAGTETFSLVHRYLDDDPSGTPSDTYTVSVVLSDSDQGTATAETTVQILNAAPDQVIVGPDQAVRGQPLSYDVQVTDPGGADTHTYAWRVTDDAGLEVASSAGATLAFIPVATGTYSVELTTTDDDTGDVVQQVPLDVAAVAEHPDPGAPQDTVFRVGGTTNRDRIVIRKGREPGTLKWRIVSWSPKRTVTRGQTAAAASGIEVYGQDGDDFVRIAGNVRVPAMVDGGGGNDKLHGGRSDDLLRGGAGSDKLWGHVGNDVLLGGAGVDTLRGQAGRDILIGGVGGETSMVGGGQGDVLIGGETESDDDDAALMAMLADWASGDDYAVRVSALLPVRIVDDGAAETLTGDGGEELFFAGPGDLLKRVSETETVVR
jgi:hypothetical protein